MYGEIRDMVLATSELVVVENKISSREISKDIEIKDEHCADMDANCSGFALSLPGWRV